jgi:hypothetical protein
MPRRKPDAIDVLIGCNIRFYRMQRIVSQTTLGKGIGFKYQQIQNTREAALGWQRVARRKLRPLCTSDFLPLHSLLFLGAS